MEIDADLAFLDAFCDAAAASGKGGRYVPRNERDPLSGETSVAFNNVLAPGRAPDTHVRNADAPLKIAAYEGPPKPASVDSGWGVVQAGSGDVVPESRAASALPADSSRGAVPPPAAGPHGPVLLAAQRSAAVVGARRWGERSSAPSDAPPPSATSIASGTRTAPDRGGADAGGRSQEARAAYGAGDTDGMDAAKRALAESLFGRGSSKERASGGSGAEGRSAGQAAVGGARRAPEPAGVSGSEGLGVVRLDLCLAWSEWRVPGSHRLVVVVVLLYGIVISLIDVVISLFSATPLLSSPLLPPTFSPLSPLQSHSHQCPQSIS